MGRSYNNAILYLSDGLDRNRSKVAQMVARTRSGRSERPRRPRCKRLSFRMPISRGDQHQEPVPFGPAWVRGLKSWVATSLRPSNRFATSGTIIMRAGELVIEIINRQQHADVSNDGGVRGAVDAVFRSVFILSLSINTIRVTTASVDDEILNLTTECRCARPWKTSCTR